MCDNSELFITDDLVCSEMLDYSAHRSIAEMERVSGLVELAIHELGETERFSIAGLGRELQRQAQLIAENGGLSTQQRQQLEYLTRACMAEMGAASIRLKVELQTILLR